jgi:hypothetical protein
LQRILYTCVFESFRRAVPLAFVIWWDFLKILNQAAEDSESQVKPAIEMVDNGDHPSDLPAFVFSRKRFNPRLRALFTVPRGASSCVATSRRVKPWR